MAQTDITIDSIEGLLRCAGLGKTMSSRLVESTIIGVMFRFRSLSETFHIGEYLVSLPNGSLGILQAKKSVSSNLYNSMKVSGQRLNTSFF